MGKGQRDRGRGAERYWLHVWTEVTLTSFTHKAEAIGQTYAPRKPILFRKPKRGFGGTPDHACTFLFIVTQDLLDISHLPIASKYFSLASAK